MGFYVRKSIKAGPFRFNMSKSGLGVSAGVPGFRVGTGPRGNYVRVGNTVSYSTTHALRAEATPPPPGLEFVPNSVIMEDVTGATAMSLAPTGGGDIVSQLNAAASRFGFGWPVTVVLAIAGLLIFPYGVIVWAAAIPLCWWLFLHDAAKRKVVLLYDVEGEAADWFDSLVSGWGWLTQSEKLWRTIQSGRVQTTYQHKTNAGAGNLVHRASVLAHLRGPKHVSTNLLVPTLIAGTSALYFLPDRLLVRERKRYTDVSYARLRQRGYGQRFIESPEAVPRDGRQIDRTWQYVNVKGGPDRRFKNNSMLPVMYYGALDLTSADGLSWRLQSSRAEAGSAIAQLLAARPQIVEAH